MTNCPKCGDKLFSWMYSPADTYRLQCGSCDFATPTIGELADMWWGLQQAGRVDREPEGRVDAYGRPLIMYGPRFSRRGDG